MTERKLTEKELSSAIRMVYFILLKQFNKLPKQFFDFVDIIKKRFPNKEELDELEDLALRLFLAKVPDPTKVLTDRYQEDAVPEIGKLPAVNQKVIQDEIRKVFSGEQTVQQFAVFLKDYLAPVTSVEDLDKKSKDTLEEITNGGDKKVELEDVTVKIDGKTYDIRPHLIPTLRDQAKAQNKSFEIILG